MIDLIEKRSAVCVVLMVALVGAAGVVSGAPMTGPPPSSEVVTMPGANDTGVGVWGQSTLALEADTATATETVSIGDWRLEGSMGGVSGESPAGMGPIGVYESNETVPVTFDASTALANESTFANESLAVYAITSGTDGPNATDNLSSLDADPESASLVDTTTIDSSGEATVSYTTESPGPVQFVALLTDDPGTDLSAADTSELMAANGTVVGLDAIMVESQTDGVSVPASGDAGEDVPVTATDSGTGAHAVLLYHEPTVANGSVTVSAKTANGSSVTVEPSIDRLNTTMRYANGSVDGSVSIDAAKAFESVGGPANGSLYRDGSPDETVVLDSALAVDSRSDNDTLRVPTRSDWTNGTYRWVYSTSNGDSTEFETGTIDITASTPGTPTPTTTTTDSGGDSGDNGGGGGGGIDITTTTTDSGGPAPPGTTTTTTETTTTTTTTTTETTTTTRTFVEATPTTEDGPGFGPLIALVAVLSAALLALRRY